MSNKVSKEIRKLILEDLILIGSCAGGQCVTEFTKKVYPDIEENRSVIDKIDRNMDRYNNWDFSYLFNTILDLLNVPDEKFLYFCEQYVNPIFIRRKYNEDDEEWVDFSQECINVINKSLSDIGMSLQPIEQIAGKTKYKVLPTNHCAQEPIKNIIFAAKYKPDIVLNDALSNDIEVVNANGALIYDQGIPANGITWELLVNWYELLDVDNTEEQMEQLFCNCLDSKPEKIFYKAYISYLKLHGKHIPALIPQVYMYYDPKTQKQRELKIFEHQKMDFMMIISPLQRVVFEIDGQQHYAEDELAPGTQYKHYASPARYAEMMRTHREMTLAGYDVYRFGGKEFLANDHISEEDIISNLSLFFNRLFEKYHIR